MTKMRTTIVRILVLFSCVLHPLIGHTNPLKIMEFDKTLLESLPTLKNSKVAFIDLSARKSGPKITMTNLAGELLHSFQVPIERYSSDWTNWGPGISFDPENKTLWFLSPQVGLTEFNMAGNVLRKIDFPKASHQMQITADKTFVIPYSWDTESDAQVSEIDVNGKVLFQWKGKEFVNKFAHTNSIAHAQPNSFTATTSAVKTDRNNYYLSLSQKDLILKLNNKGEVIWQKNVSIRPHTLVVKGDELIGYSARSPNRLIIKGETCNCDKEVVLDEIIGGKMSTRSLSLQSLGKGFWFSSGVIGLYILDENGKIYWKLEHEGLRGRPIGFHAAVLFMAQ